VGGDHVLLGRLVFLRTLDHAALDHLRQEQLGGGLRLKRTEWKQEFGEV
jgi:hypothetical protein